MKPTTDSAGYPSGTPSYPSPPTVSQPAAPTIPQRIMFNRSYLFSITSFMRIALIVSVLLIKIEKTNKTSI